MSLVDMLPRPLRLRDGWGLVRCVRAQDGSRVRVLEVGGTYQSATYVGERWAEPVFSYYRAFDRAFLVRPGTRRLLMVGGGGYAWPKHVLATRPADVTLDVVELDPAVTRAARRWFYVDEALGRWPGRLRLVEGDGLAYLEGRALRITSDAGAAGGTRPRSKEASGAELGHAAAPSLRYDAIALDAFVGPEPVRSLATARAARAAKGCLVADGLVLANVVSEGGGADVSFLVETMTALRTAFAQVHAIPCEDDPFAAEDNYLVIASDAPWPAPGAIGGEPAGTQGLARADIARTNPAESS